MDVPRLAGEGGAVNENGMFFASTLSNRSLGGSEGPAMTEAMEKLLKELDGVEAKLREATGNRSALFDQRADILRNS